VAFGHEIGTAYSELIDPLSSAFINCAIPARRRGDAEAMQLDEDFLRGWSTRCRPPVVWEWCRPIADDVHRASIRQTVLSPSCARRAELMTADGVVIRRARTADVRSIRTFIDVYADDRILLSKAPSCSNEDVQEFLVAELDGA